MKHRKQQKIQQREKKKIYYNANIGAFRHYIFSAHTYVQNRNKKLF